MTGRLGRPTRVPSTTGGELGVYVGVVRRVTPGPGGIGVAAADVEVPALAPGHVYPDARVAAGATLTVGDPVAVALLENGAGGLVVLVRLAPL